MSAEDSVADILGDWYERGELEDPEEVIRAHPGLEGELRAGFAARELLGCARGGRIPPPLAGVRTIGDFRIVREIGRGGMGVVYEAEQISMGRRVALKLLDPAITFSARAVERFRREAQAAGRLHHAHLVPIYAMGEADGVWYYAMEWVRGTTLADVISNLREQERKRESSPAAASSGRTTAEGRAEFARVAMACAGVADALAVAHAAGVIHRDVKPANLIFDEKGTLKVMDFGLARVEGDASRTVTGDLLGTPTYMSPEQARGGAAPVDGRTDVYSLGATLYELATLRPPFDGESAHDICTRLVTQEPPRPRRLRPAIPRDLETIVLKAMEKDAERRYRTAGEMAEDLRAFAEGRSIRARPVGFTGRAWRGARRHGAFSALGAVVVLLAALVGVLAAKAAREPRSSRGAAGQARAMAAHASAGDPATREIGADWAALEQIPVASYGLGAAVVGGKLYAISGFFTPRVGVYDPARDAWSDATPLRRPLQYFGTAVIDARIYVAGGDLGGTGASADLDVYDPAAATWTTRPPMPGGARWHVGAAELGGKLYVVGGLDGATGASLSRVEVFDPATSRWEARAPMPTPRALAGALGAIGGKLYVAGGNSGSSDVSTLEIYDPARDAWTSGASLPRPLVAQAAVVDGRLFMVGGGEDATGVSAYDPRTDTWTSEPPLIWERRAHGVAFDPVRHRLYAICGFVDGSLPFIEVCSPRTPPAPR